MIDATPTSRCSRDPGMDQAGVSAGAAWQTSHVEAMLWQ